jgi:hypothetical protein
LCGSDRRVEAISSGNRTSHYQTSARTFMEVTTAVDGHAVFVDQDDEQIHWLKVAFNAMV